MIQRKHIFYLPVSSLLLLLFIFLTPSCNCDNPSPSDESTQETFKKKKKEKVKKPVVVLLHGLGHTVGSSSNLELVKAKLVTDLKAANKDVMVIAPARDNFLSYTISQQADALYAQLQQDYKDSDFIFYGHSQGAVLAAYLWCKHGSNLKIRGLILDRGPLAGFFPLRDDFNKTKFENLLSK